MSKYYDTSAVVQVIAGIYTKPELLDIEDKYTFNEEDFEVEEFHRIIFGSIYNLHQLGAKEISISTIEDYLEQRPKKYAIYKSNKGAEYLQNLEQSAQIAAFDFYYSRLKKMTLLRMYDKAGMDLKWLYDDDNILDTKKRQKQEEWLDSHSLDDIADIIDKRISDIRIKYVSNSDDNFIQAGDKIHNLIERLEKNPEFGYPLYGPLVNTVHRGARLKKLYLRSAATGLGKTRTMIADVCSIGCDRIYDIDTNKWIENGTKEPVLFIATEQDEEEVQTMMLSFLSAVNEEHILTGKYEESERDRVIKAAELLSKSPIHIKKLPDFSLQDIENTIKYSIREFGSKYIFFDYIHSSMKILSEIGSRSGVKGLREDNILFLMATKLKDLCNQYGVFILTSTQLNAGYTDAQSYDQNLLRGAKSIADRIDMGMIMLSVNEDDRAKLKDIVAGMGLEMPTIKISIYKNRRGRYKDILLWCKSDLGICRVEPMFATNYRMELIPIDDIKIRIVSKMSASAF